MLLYSIRPAFSQEEIVTFKNLINLSQTKIENVLPIVNQKNGDISFFFVDAKNVYGCKLDSNFAILQKVSSKRKERKYKKLIGYDILDDTTFNFYFSNKNNNKFASVKFSFLDKESTFKELTIDLENEKFIQSINYNNEFYLITIENYKSILYLYSFDKEKNIIKNTIDLTNEIFLNSRGHKDNLYNIIKYTSGSPSLNYNLVVSKIDEKNPNSIEITSKKVKLYQKGNTVLLTLDYNKDYTQIIHIDLKDYSHFFQTITKPFYEISTSNKKTNSFINGKNLYMIAATKKNLYLQ